MSCAGCYLSAMIMALIIMISVCVFGIYVHLDSESRRLGQCLLDIMTVLHNMIEYMIDGIEKCAANDDTSAQVCCCV